MNCLTEKPHAEKRTKLDETVQKRIAVYIVIVRIPVSLFRCVLYSFVVKNCVTLYYITTLRVASLKKMHTEKRTKLNETA